MKTKLKDGIYCLRLFQRHAKEIQFDLLENKMTYNIELDPNNFNWKALYIENHKLFDKIKTKEIFLVEVHNNIMKIYNNDVLLNKGITAHKLWESYMVNLWSDLEALLKEEE